MILQAGRAFFHHFEQTGVPLAEIQLLEATIRDIIKHYSGWTGRRNDVAHGYVTAAQHPDYERGGVDIVTTYQLCPSHSNSRKWPLWTPILEHPQYQYKAIEIVRFAEAFEALDKRTTEYAVTLDEWRKKQPGASPPQSIPPI